MNTPTPRTDAAIQCDCVGDYVHVDFARQLEREIADSQEQARLGWLRAAEKDRAYGQMIAERDKLSEELSAIYAESDTERIASLTETASNALQRNETLLRELAALRSWKESMLAVESEWRAQLAIANSLVSDRNALRAAGDRLADVMAASLNDMNRNGIEADYVKYEAALAEWNKVRNHECTA